MLKKCKKIRYALELVAVKLGIFIFSVMKPQKASDVAATISKFVGKKISVQKLALKNLAKAMPNLTENQRYEIIENMWDNLGRIVGEYVHISKLNAENIDQIIELDQDSLSEINALKQANKGGIIFSAHYGNWEIGPKAFLNNGIKVKTVYRPLNNPFVEKLTADMRGVEMIAKGSSGNRQIIEAIKNKEFVIILADQKVTEGEPVKFFHDDAITTTSMARIALKYNVPLIPARSIRIGKKFKFKVEVEKPLAIEATQNLNQDLLTITSQINKKIEDWVKEFPHQWFWVHNRWKK